MKGATLPPALLCGALGLALACAPRRAWTPSLIALALTAGVLAVAPVPISWSDRVLLGCWMSAAAIAGAVHAPRGVPFLGAIALSINAGCWCGVVAATAGSLRDLATALPCVLILVPAAWLVRGQLPITVKVVSSWLIAVAVLAATLQLLPVTPGYMPDHME